MTYCLAMLVREGLAMLADTRTNAGVDDVSAYRKLHVFRTPGERTMVLATAGSLSVTQTAISMLENGVKDPDSGKTETLLSVPSMLGAAGLVGATIRKVRAGINVDPSQEVRTDATVLMGGQIVGQPMRLFLIYSAGNFIECEPDTPFLQAGEHKYGKPILDRSLSYETPLTEALKLGFLSLDATLRSNVAVGLPADVLTLPRDAIDPEVEVRIEPDDPYFGDLGSRWSSALRDAVAAIPDPPW